MTLALSPISVNVSGPLNHCSFRSNPSSLSRSQSHKRLIETQSTSTKIRNKARWVLIQYLRQTLILAKTSSALPASPPPFPLLQRSSGSTIRETHLEDEVQNQISTEEDFILL